MFDKLSKALNIPSDELVPLYKVYGGASPRSLANLVLPLKRQLKTIEFGCGVSTLVLADGRQHTVITDDPDTPEIFGQYTKDINYHVTKLDGWYKWEPKLGELYDIVYVHHNRFDNEAILKRIPEVVGPNGRIFVDNIPDETTYNVYEELGLRLGLQILPFTHDDRLLVYMTANNAIIGTGPGATLLHLFKAMGIPACQQCNAMANKMNKWGNEECIERLEEIVADLLPRAQRWWKHSKPWMKAGVWFKLDQSAFEHAKSYYHGGIDQLLADSIRDKVLQAIYETDITPLAYSDLPPIEQQPIDLVFDATGTPADMQNMYTGASVFLLCGGPSLNQMNLDMIPDSAIVASINQVGATHKRPHLWFGVDHPKRFHANIWEDPAITKFTALGHCADYYSNLVGDEWVPSGRSPQDMPNTYFVKYNEPWFGDKYLESPTSWATRDGSRSTMMIALRMLYWLGFRSVYLLGCDFQMTYKGSYAFGEICGPKIRARSNVKFQALNSTLEYLFPTFDKHGFHVYNCTPDGNLHALPRVDFTKACGV